MRAATGTRIGSERSLTVTCAPNITRPYGIVTRSPRTTCGCAVGTGAITIMSSKDTILNLKGVNTLTTVPIVRKGTILFGRFNNIGTIPVYLSARSARRVVGSMIGVTPTFNKVGLRSVSTPHYFRVRAHLGRLLGVPIFRSSRRKATVIILTKVVGTLGMAKGGGRSYHIMIGKTKSTKITVAGLLLACNFPRVAVYSVGKVVSGDSPGLG